MSTRRMSTYPSSSVTIKKLWCTVLQLHVHSALPYSYSCHHHSAKSDRFTLSLSPTQRNQYATRTRTPTLTDTYNRLSSTFLCHHTSYRHIFTSTIHYQQQRQQAYDAPMFNHTFRRFLKQVHPDLFENYPLEQQCNSTSLQQLLSIVTDIKSTDKLQPYPSRKHCILKFYVRQNLHSHTHGTLNNSSNSRRSKEIQHDFMVRLYRASNIAADKAVNSVDAEKYYEKYYSRSSNQTRDSYKSLTCFHQSNAWCGWSLQHTNQKDHHGHHFYLLSIILSLNGGDCKRSVERSLSVMFALAGLPPTFQWDSDYWQLKDARVVYNENDEREYWDHMAKEEDESTGEYQYG